MFARPVALTTRTFAKLLCGLLAAVAIAGESARAQTSFGPQGPEEGVIRRQTWLIPAHDRMTMMRSIVYRPPGPGPFPLAVINHGSTQNEMRRATQRQPEYAAAAQWFVAHGYAVAVPQRPGHGETGGPYYEQQGGCADADYRRAGLGAAAGIAAAIDFMTRQPFVRKTGAVAVGQSAGGWGALALSTQVMRELKAVVAFAPGRGGRADDVAGRNCAPDRLIAAARAFGERARVPTLWITAENDSYFAPVLSKKLVDAFRLGGGKAEYHLLPPIGSDGHELILAAQGIDLWGPLLEKFLKVTR
jgi:dienelactone hydrolase